ncbi:hypothetical protein JXL21_01730 [Candidatus Bathyarchaeota archaeon]|nr:hypothetical protein [Candidatus Bathyarchaeota archaeon]
MPSVSLATTLHDSTGWTLQPLHETARLLAECYGSRLTVVTEGTKPEVVEALREAGWVVVEPKSRVGVQYISESRRRVLRASLETGQDYTHLVDMDRALHWALSYPEELRRVAEAIPGHGFLVLGRTRRAMETHPSNQTETEALANKVFSLIVGREMDITAASRGVSREAAETILRYSRGRFFDSDSEWPVILHCMGYELGYMEVKGLEWETRLKRMEMTLPGGEKVDSKDYYEGNPESWVYRLMLAHGIARAAYRTSRAFSR